MPLRLDNAKSVAHMPTAEAATDNEDLKPRFKIDHAASPMPKTRQPERLAPRATSNRNGGRDHLGMGGRDQIGIPGRDRRNRQAAARRLAVSRDFLSATLTMRATGCPQRTFDL